jgi:hypothetical protein
LFKILKSLILLLYKVINYEVDIDFKLTLEDLKDDVKLIKKFLGDDKYLSSISLFKKLYNRACDDSNLNIDEPKLNEYNLIKCINENINDKYSRY